MKNSKNCWTVYRHITPDGKIYVGCTSKKPERRWNNGNHYRKNTPFGKAIEKYKWENIKHEILDTDLDEFTAKCLEEYYIFSYRTYIGFSDCNGYNCTLGGDGTVGHHHTPWNKGKTGVQVAWNKGISPSKETRHKQSEANKGKTPWNKGKNTSGMKGKHHKEEAKEKISESLKGKPSWSKGKHFSEEHKRKISESKKGKHWKLIDGKRVYYE